MGSVLGIWDIATEVAQGSIVQHNKSRVATGEIDDIAYIYLAPIAVIMNETHVIKYYKVVHINLSYIIEAFEDASHIPFLPLDLALFGQLVLLTKPVILVFDLIVRTL